MHVLQPKHTKLSRDEAKQVISKLCISAMQLPKIKVTDPALPKDTQLGDVIKIERKYDNKKIIYYRVVVA
ncbi:MAG: DNA-directed RNA polymerase subunit H [Candidatus Pacearchaeota archaeon]|nr:DNA-directed RNA polymerase subunit H [Candidatus Pacearchaeota archaeon]